jgi:glycosyltransferase involved in cell wall biosynthesis
MTHAPPTDGADLVGRLASTPDRPVRIALILPGLGAGGTERVVNVLANAWARRGWAVTVACFEPPGTPAYYPFDPRVTLHRLGAPAPARPRLRAPLRVPQRIGALRRALRAAKPELVISFLARTNVMTLIATAGLGLRVVVSERNNPELQTFGPIWGGLRRLLYPHAHGLVTMTAGALAVFPRAVRRRGRVIVNPVELPPGWRARRGGNVLAAVGRLVPQKGFDLLLEAFARVAAERPAWRLVIWGEGEERARLERQRDALGLAGRVELPGITTTPGAWVETADAFVLSSRFEGWGIVLTEAMAAGLPVVSFDCEFGPRDMVEDGVDGLLVPREDVAALARALGALLGDAELRERLGARARISARRFAPDQVVAAWEALVREVTTGGVAVACEETT